MVVAISIHVPIVSGEVVTWKLAEVFLDEASLVLPEVAHEGGRGWKLNIDKSFLLHFGRLTSILIDYVEFESGSWLSCRSRLKLEGFEVLEIREHEIAAFRLPIVVVEEAIWELMGEPFVCWYIAAFSSKRNAM